MDRPDPGQHLGEIETHWSDILEAHRGEGEAQEARARLAIRYIGAVRRYIGWVLRDEDAAAELAQEFAVRVLRGDFRRADPGRGRFRDYVRTAAANLIRDHHRRRRAHPVVGADEAPEPVAPPEEADEPDAEFLRSWRMELFSRSMAALAVYQERTGRPYHDLISLRTGHPQLTSGELAALYSARSGKPVGDVWVRQTLRRARAGLADFLLDEVAASLGGGSCEDLERELIVLDLLSYCQESLRRRARRSGAPDTP